MIRTNIIYAIAGVRKKIYLVCIIEMSITCLNVISNLNKSVDKVNFKLIDNMTDAKMKYDLVCVKPDVTYQYFYQTLKEEWETIINNFINQPQTCGMLSNLITMAKYLDPAKLAQFRQIFEAASQGVSSTESDFGGVNIDDIVLDVLATSIMSKDTGEFGVQESAPATLVSLAKVIGDNCNCQMVDIFKTVAKKYSRKYKAKYEGKTKEEIIEGIRADYHKFKELLKIGLDSGMGSFKVNLLDDLANKLTGIYGFSVGSELERLIPNELGSLKDFFIKIITTYYENLHPIIWAQIFKQMTENVFKELPFTPDEIFAYVSKYLLLNSGPFILKILQMIRPVLSPELQKKYNLTKLKYPLMKENQVNLVLSKVVNDWDMYEIMQHFSASVGHVCKVRRADDPANIFIIKIIKPVSIAQSCWEYKTLHDLFPEQPCEQAFIKNMLKSNGRELNVQNEIENLKKGHEYYTETYNNVFSVDINARLTSVENIPGIIKPNTWFALTMTLAPGVPLSYLVENDLIKADTKYRAKLHRCLDLLVYKFFFNIVKNGFYHGDLHAGNIFFSYENSQITLIDFGAVGEIDIYEDDPAILSLLDIVVMSMFYNYDEMFDRMTELLNAKCPETQIDMTSPAYATFKEELSQYKFANIKNNDIEKQKAEKYANDIFSEKRIAEEKAADQEQSEPIRTVIVGPVYPHYLVKTSDDEAEKSIYSYLELKEKPTEPIIENADRLPVFTEILGDVESHTFSSVLEKIITFYAKSGVNIAIKFSDFYEFQKAYALLLGVLSKVGYNSYRSGLAIRKAIVNWKNIPELIHVKTVAHVTKTYLSEKSKFGTTVEQLVQKKSGITKQLSDPKDTEGQCMAGGSNNDYYRKYMKYKSKYINLKK